MSEINDKNKTIKNGAEREAINMPIQGTSADIIKLAMIRVAEFLKSPPPIPLLSKEGEAHQGGGGLKSKMIMQVHDELVFDVYPGEEEVLAKNVQEIMQSILPDAPVDLKVDVGIGRTWKEAK
ncbi:MAG: hypothetical protein H6767_01495 [Candidatus Peribacteria bacterium]|nr:MAG: hypothetical protein H6767_01495 [Candidatus Peribacteria bacterium]